MRQIPHSRIYIYIAFKYRVPVLHSYLKLLDINYSEGSICPECGPTPNIIVCDATTVAFCRKMVLHGISEDSNNDRFENISCGI